MASTSSTTTTRQGYGAWRAFFVVTIPVVIAGLVFLGYELLHHVGTIAGIPKGAVGVPVVAGYQPPLIPPLVQGSSAANTAGVATAITGDVLSLAGGFESLFGGGSAGQSGADASGG